MQHCYHQFSQVELSMGSLYHHLADDGNQTGSKSRIKISKTVLCYKENLLKETGIIDQHQLLSHNVYLWIWTTSVRNIITVKWHHVAKHVS